jgi:hypothetical protein
MQDPASGLPRILFPRTTVNKGKRKGWVSKDPALLITASDLLLVEVDYLKFAVFFCASRVAWRVYSNGTLVNASAHCSKKRLCASSRSSRISKTLLVRSSSAFV